MKKVLLIALTSLIFSLTTAAQQSPVEKAVLQLEQDWVNALVKADAAKLETLYADTLVYTHSSGSVRVNPSRRSAAISAAKPSSAEATGSSGGGPRRASKAAALACR